MNTDVLYVGSGKSALLISEINTSGFITCAVNNAWKLFTDIPLNYWIHTGDFISKDRPLKNSTIEIDHTSYVSAASIICKKFNIDTEFPNHHIGYTIFFQGLYWIMTHLKPKNIFLLGFDHDYNPKKVKLWIDAGCPAPHNNYLCKSPISDPAPHLDIFFKDMEPDAFYGHGTPDPLRLGESEMNTFFTRAKDYSQKLNINITNLSGITSGLNTFSQTDISPFLKK
jgi:hypothetical protein